MNVLWESGDLNAQKIALVLMGAIVILWMGCAYVLLALRENTVKIEFVLLNILVPVVTRYVSVNKTIHNFVIPGRVSVSVCLAGQVTTVAVLVLLLPMEKIAKRHATV